MPNKKYATVALGGTFDHFHKGHETFISFAAGLADRLTIGVTTPELISQKPLAELCEDYETRARSVAAFCERQGISCEIIPLHDIYGSTLRDSSAEALCVTEETLEGGERINRARSELGLPPLPIHVCEYYASEFGQPLHSCDIRKGLVNREGKTYARILQDTVVLSDRQRSFFAKPQGVLRTPVARRSGERVFVVGDVTLEHFIEHQLPYQLGVYDKKVRRAEIHSPVIDGIEPDLTAENEPGTISRSLTEALQEALRKRRKHLLVEGEEDLATVALVLLVPLQANVYYGQPDKGIVEITVTEAVKEAFARALR